MEFKERSEKFQDEVAKLQEKYKIELYAAQVILQTGEIATLIKLRDLLPPKEQVEEKK